ncbi:MAG TPA: nitrous oxide reductase accessory protein NosL [Polyangiaceae bacterium]|nr:nitrous oxide reductase accessory protein NosL [Polyangiaceae bacterium]
MKPSSLAPSAMRHAPPLSRRRALGALFALTLAPALASGCKKDASTTPAAAPPGRCAHCGMKLTAGSAWLTELVAADGSKKTFDTPRCALTARLAGGAAKLRVQDFYDRTWRDGGEVLFVVGSDVLGPMGPDLVPVDTARAPKFLKDHEGDRALKLEEITKAVLEDLK